MTSGNSGRYMERLDFNRFHFGNCQFMTISMINEVKGFAISEIIKCANTASLKQST